MGKEYTCNAEDTGDAGLDPESGRCLTLSLPGKSHGQRSLVDYSPCGCRVKTCACVLSHLSRVQLFAALWTVAHQAPLSMGFSKQEYWSGFSVSSSRASSQLRDQTHISCVFYIGRWILYQCHLGSPKESDRTEQLGAHTTF